jgi:hypothetical protein
VCPCGGGELGPSYAPPYAPPYATGHSESRVQTFEHTLHRAAIPISDMAMQSECGSYHANTMPIPDQPRCIVYVGSTVEVRESAVSRGARAWLAGLCGVLMSARATVRTCVLMPIRVSGRKSGPVLVVTCVAALCPRREAMHRTDADSNGGSGGRPGARVASLSCRNGTRQGPEGRRSVARPRWRALEPSPAAPSGAPRLSGASPGPGPPHAQRKVTDRRTPVPRRRSAPIELSYVLRSHPERVGVRRHGARGSEIRNTY